MGPILGSGAPRRGPRPQGGSDRARRGCGEAPGHGSATPGREGLRGSCEPGNSAPAGQVQDAGAEAPSARPPVAMGLAGDEGRPVTASTRQRLTVLFAPPLAAGGLAVVSGR